MSLKDIINPLALFPLILIIIISAGIRGINMIIYPSIAFLAVSLLNNLILLTKKQVSSNFYMFVYVELFFSLIFIIPLMILADIQRPIIISLFIISIADLYIQSYYNIYPRKDGKNIARLWKKHLMRQKREIFHPISLQIYEFKDFTCRILDPENKNPSRNHILHYHFMKPKTEHHIIKHQYKSKENIAFCLKELNTKKNSKKRIKDKNIIDSFTDRFNTLRIIMKKGFVKKNPQKAYIILKNIAKKYKKNQTKDKT